MAYRVKTANFEGPFELLLELVNRQKVDIGSISITEIADQYLAEVASMELIDLDVASDFLWVAATLLEIKATHLLSKPSKETAEELEETQRRAVSLIERLFAYQKFKTAAAALASRGQLQQHRHGRYCEPDEEFFDVQPDFLSGITLEALARRAAKLLGSEDVELLESKHIAAPRAPLERYVNELLRLVAAKKTLSFFELVGENPSRDVFVVHFLAILELVKRQQVKLVQTQSFGDIRIEWRKPSQERTINVTETSPKKAVEES